MYELSYVRHNIWHTFVGIRESCYNLKLMLDQIMASEHYGISQVEDVKQVGR